MKHEKSSTAEWVRTVLAVIKSRESFKEDTVLFLADAKTLAVAIKFAAQRLPKSASEISASEISEAIALIAEDVTRSVDGKAVILDVNNQADEEEDAFEREWRNARRAHTEGNPPAQA